MLLGARRGGCPPPYAKPQSEHSLTRDTHGWADKRNNTRVQPAQVSANQADPNAYDVVPLNVLPLNEIEQTLHVSRRPPSHRRKQHAGRRAARTQPRRWCVRLRADLATPHGRALISSFAVDVLPQPCSSCVSLPLGPSEQEGFTLRLGSPVLLA